MAVGQSDSSALTFPHRLTPLVNLEARERATSLHAVLRKWHILKKEGEQSQSSFQSFSFVTDCFRIKITYAEFP